MSGAVRGLLALGLGIPAAIAILGAAVGPPTKADHKPNTEPVTLNPATFPSFGRAIVAANYSCRSVSRIEMRKRDARGANYAVFCHPHPDGSYLVTQHQNGRFSVTPLY
jgi:hypothetical protein